MKNLLPAKFGVVIASVVLVAGVEAAEPEAVDGETPQTTETPVASQENEQSTYDLYHTVVEGENLWVLAKRFTCLLYTSPSPRDLSTSRMPSSA